MSIIYRQPLDVLELIVDEVDWREDLLSLALTCTFFHNIVIPSHLAYRRVIISIFFRPFFEQIVPRPDLARRVRELTLVDTPPTFEVPREHAFRRHYPESRLLYASGYDDESKSVWANAGDVGGRLNISRSLMRPFPLYPAFAVLSFAGASDGYHLSVFWLLITHILRSSL